MQAGRKTENGQTDRQIDRKAWFGICRVGRLEERQKTDRQMGGQTDGRTDRRTERLVWVRPELPCYCESREQNCQHQYYLKVFRGAHIETGVFVLIVSNKHI